MAESIKKVFKNLSLSRVTWEFKAECGTVIDPFVTCLIEPDQGEEFDGEDVTCTGHFYKGCFLVGEIEVKRKGRKLGTF